MIEDLLNGYRNYTRNRTPEHVARLQQLGAGQSPKGLVIACCDSRVVPLRFLGANPGDLFYYRNIGNIIPAFDAEHPEQTDETNAVLEFAVGNLGLRDIIVCGHSNCGAMEGAMAGTVPHDTGLGRWLQHIGEARNRWGAPRSSESRLETVNRLSQTNVLVQCERLRTYPVVNQLGDAMRLHAWWYSIGEDTLYRSMDSETFEPIAAA